MMMKRWITELPGETDTRMGLGSLPRDINTVNQPSCVLLFSSFQQSFMLFLWGPSLLALILRCRWAP